MTCVDCGRAVRHCERVTFLDRAMTLARCGSCHLRVTTGLSVAPWRPGTLSPLDSLRLVNLELREGLRE